jgi:hypothetical protein
MSRILKGVIVQAQFKIRTQLRRGVIDLLTGKVKVRYSGFGFFVFKLYSASHIVVEGNNNTEVQNQLFKVKPPLDVSDFKWS